MAANPEPWLARQLGVLAPGASPALREEYARRAGAAAAYREAAGITDPEQAVSPDPHLASPELENLRGATIRALEIRNEVHIIRGMSRGELEAQVLEGERAQASAPPDMSGRLRLTAQAEADALRQFADAQAQHNETGAYYAKALALQMAAERERLEAGNTRYETWAAATHDRRTTAGKARAELQRRGQAQPQVEPQVQPADQPQAMTRWWREFEADAEAAERAIARQHQAAIDAGKPWPPQRTPEPDPSFAPSPDPGASPQDEPAHDDRAARLGELLVRADQAAQRVAAHDAERQASSEYAARIEREAQAEPGAVQHAEARDGAEIEL